MSVPNFSAALLILKPIVDLRAVKVAQDNAKLNMHKEYEWAYSEFNYIFRDNCRYTLLGHLKDFKYKITQIHKSF